MAPEQVRCGAMYIDFSSLFHKSSKDLTDRGRANIPKDPEMWPKEWKTVRYKSYPSVPKITLSQKKPKADFFELVEKRKSRRDFGGAPISKDTLSTLLLYSCGIVKKTGGANTVRAHPSGGGIFPLEIYPIVFSGSDEIPAGLYHYNVKEHALDTLWRRPFSKADIAELFVYDWVGDASCALILTAIFHRDQMKYGERGYRYVLLDAGYIGENVYLAAEALNLKCCGMGGTLDENLEKLIDIDGISESLVHALILG